VTTTATTCLAAALLLPAPAGPDDAALRKVVADYVALYRHETLAAWRRLFLPSFSVASTNADGSVRRRNLEEFYAAQERYLASGRAIREELENVTIERRGRLASAWADFVLSDEGERSRGKLCLLLIQEQGQWRIQALIFGYDDAN
jgi:hypothetical protein